jgi:hypothetical protein
MMSQNPAIVDERSLPGRQAGLDRRLVPIGPGLVVHPSDSEAVERRLKTIGMP